MREGRRVREGMSEERASNETVLAASANSVQQHLLVAPWQASKFLSWNDEGRGIEGRSKGGREGGRGETLNPKLPLFCTTSLPLLTSPQRPLY